MPKETFYNLDDEKKQRIEEASIQEFAYHTYEEIKLSRIIKAAKIPRGSFYQYFEDKKDLYIHIFGKIAEEKMKYMNTTLQNPNKIPFLELFRELYKSGLAFAIDNPDYIRISKNLMLNRGQIFKELLADGFEIAREYYVNWIETDKKNGHIRKDVDSRLLADIMIDTTTNIAFDELSEGKELDPEKMMNRMENIIKILQKGIE